LIVVESLESAMSRTPRPKIYCEIVGYSMNSDAYHVLSPMAEGEGLSDAIE
jgi:3-oxoacyl-[acyl-carrier-protein] synthase II